MDYAEKPLPTIKQFRDSISSVLNMAKPIDEPESLGNLCVGAHINLKVREENNNPPWYVLMDIGYYEDYILYNDQIDQDDKRKLKPIYKAEKNGYEVHRVDYFSSPEIYAETNYDDIAKVVVPVLEQVHPGFFLNYYEEVSLTKIDLLKDKYDVIKAVNMRNMHAKGKEEPYIDSLKLMEKFIDNAQHKLIAKSCSKAVFNFFEGVKTDKIPFCRYDVSN